MRGGRRNAEHRAGGVRIDVGIDADGNGKLTSEEVHQTAYVCNGQDSANAPDSGAGSVDAGVGGGSVACNSRPDDDADGDGWTVSQGDCDDCNPVVNPGAIDVWHPGVGGAAGFWGNESCDNAAGPPSTCDQLLALDDVSASSAAMALDICRSAMTSGSIRELQLLVFFNTRPATARRC